MTMFKRYSSLWSGVFFLIYLLFIKKKRKTTKKAKDEKTKEEKKRELPFPLIKNKEKSFF